MSRSRDVTLRAYLSLCATASKREKNENVSRQASVASLRSIHVSGRRRPTRRCRRRRASGLPRPVGWTANNVPGREPPRSTVVPHGWRGGAAPSRGVAAAAHARHIIDGSSSGRAPTVARAAAPSAAAAHPGAASGVCAAAGGGGLRASGSCVGAEGRDAPLGHWRYGRRVVRRPPPLPPPSPPAATAANACIGRHAPTPASAGGRRRPTE